MKVIFSDIDGVLDDCNSFDKKMARFELLGKDDTKFKEIDESKIELLASICKELGANLVFCSYWKIFYDRETKKSRFELLQNILDKLKESGLETIDFTPDSKVNDETYHHDKSYDIFEYLKQHPEVESYCVIGDIKDELDLHNDNLIVTSWDYDGHGNGGIQPFHKEEIGRILNRHK